MKFQEWLDKYVYDESMDKAMEYFDKEIQKEIILDEKKQIAENMLNDNFSIEKIMKLTGLSKEDMDEVLYVMKREKEIKESKKKNNLFDEK